MSIRRFVPLAIAGSALLSAGAHRVGVPVAPVAIITMFGAVLIALQLEDQKIGNFVEELVRAFKAARHV